MKADLYAMTVDPTNGHTYWQKGSFVTKGDVVKHVKRYSQGSKHIVIYRMDVGGYLQFDEHMAMGTY